ncbi:MAG: rod-binding protein [Lachnoclostridium sp.]|jgi:flagellar protein FlgJ|nr:rod-binding protein [Lachnoclostridium sp.]
MDFSIDNIYSNLMNSGTGTSAGTMSPLVSSADTAGSVASGQLQQKIQNAQTDAEMMDACKQFEAYFVEQMYKNMQATVMKSEEEENQYTEMFGDMLTQEYASAAVEAQGIGIAQMLYESMKNNAAAAKSAINLQSNDMSASE